MKKRMLAMLLVLAMLASYLPVGAVAEQQGTPDSQGTGEVVTTYEPLQTHGAGHICEHCVQVWENTPEATRPAAPVMPEWTAWDGTMALEDGKHYVLSVDTFTPAATIALSSGTYVLCLNGKTIDGSQAGTIFNLSGTAELTILDCTAHTVTPGSSSTCFASKAL